MNYSMLATEQTNERSANLDQMSALEIVTLMNELDSLVLSAVQKALPQIAQTADLAAERIAAGGRMFYMGAGTSGRLGVLDAAECPPTFGIDHGVIIGLMAGGNAAIERAKEDAEDSEELAIEDMDQQHFNEKDMVVAVSASGTAPYCIGALKHAKALGGMAVSVACNVGAPISQYADIAIEMPTGAEVLSGSTRLRAGTATKLALNMISTCAMVRMGKAYKNLMVDVKPTNTKLKDRAVRIAMKAMDVEREEAEALLSATNDNIKQAIVMKEAGVSPEQALTALENSKGFVRKAIEMAQNI